MSHCLGVRCYACQCVLISDAHCPEGCIEGHGYSYQQRNEWASEIWPEHPCFQEDR